MAVISAGTVQRMTWQFTMTGLLIGALVGLTGMGGGSLMTPILIFLFGFDPAVAIGTDILHGAIFKSFGAARHRKLGQVHARLAMWMLLGSAPMSLLGVGFGSWLQHHYGSGVQHLQQQILGYALVACGLGFMAKALVRTAPKPDLPLILVGRDKLIAVTLGLAGGFVVGLTSVGSGTFFGLVLMLVFPLTAAKIVGTDLLHAAALLWVAGIGHLIAGNVDLQATGWLLLGSVPGVLVGSNLTVRMPDRTIRVALAITLTLSGFKLIDFPGSSIAVLVGLGVGAAGLIVVGLGDWVAHRQRSKPAESLLSQNPGG
jgi:uncharacterized membrane protein YfcA